MSIDYVQKFIDSRKHLIENRDYRNTWGKIRKSTDKKSMIELPSPEILPAFAGYLTSFEKRNHDKHVFFRGESKYHATTIPSLFRSKKPLSSIEIQARVEVIDELVNELPDLFEASRFDDFEMILQHYGIKTKWIDLADNILVALWFANYGSIGEYTYVKFFVDGSLRVQNLSEEHVSLTLRPHCQRGFSVTRRGEFTPENIDLNSNLIAIARVPRMKHLPIPQALLFPDEELDNTYKYLLQRKFREKLKEISDRYHVDYRVFGTIDRRYTQGKSC